MTTYRESFQPSEQLAQPYGIAAVNVIAAAESATAQDLASRVLRSRVRSLAGRVPAYAGRLDDATLDQLIDSPVGDQARHMMTYTAIGDREDVAQYLADFRATCGADELMITNPAPGLDARLTTLDILATLP